MTFDSIYLLSECITLTLPAILDPVFGYSGLAAAVSQSVAPPLEANQIFHLGAPIKAILDPILILIGMMIGFILWGVWRYKRKQRETALDTAWQQVLADPHYLERRKSEERRFFTKETRQEDGEQ